MRTHIIEKITRDESQLNILVCQVNPRLPQLPEPDFIVIMKIRMDPQYLPTVVYVDQEQGRLENWKGSGVIQI